MELRTEKLSRFKIILILIFIFSCLPMVFLYTFLRNFSFLSTSINNYLQSGSSIFFPMVPTIDFFGFVPVKFKITSFTLGHLIDIIIIANIVFYSESMLYHYIRSVFFSYKRIEYTCNLEIYLNAYEKNPNNFSNKINGVMEFGNNSERSINLEGKSLNKDFVLLIYLKSILGRQIWKFSILDLIIYKGVMRLIKQFEDIGYLFFHTYRKFHFFNLLSSNTLLLTNYLPEDTLKSNSNEKSSGLMTKLTVNELNYYSNQQKLIKYSNN